MLGKHQKVIVQWPSILSLVFLLGRFIYILVKDIRIHLQLEAEVSRKYPRVTLVHWENDGACLTRIPAAGAGGVDGAAQDAACPGPAEENTCVQVGHSLPLLSHHIEMGLHQVHKLTWPRAKVRGNLKAARPTYCMRTADLCTSFLPVSQEASRLVPETSLRMGSKLQIPKQDHWNCHNIPYWPIYSKIRHLKPLIV